MDNYQKINIILGWVVFAFSTIVFLLTVEPTASYWDCGEFIACASNLEVPHPPGAPFFLLVGRIFSMLAFGDETKIAYWINIISVLSSSFTVLFLFWSITHLSKKILTKSDEVLGLDKTILIFGAGLVGAIAYNFTDSFWFSAVEAEVYAMSSFFTAFVFWAILKWENIEEQSQANKWLILIAYIIGLSIGIHLLNLVTIPALALIVYFKKTDKITIKGILLTMVISGAIIIGIMNGIITGLPILAGKFEIFFINSIGLPFGSGVVIFIVLFLAAIVFGIIYSIKKDKVVLNTVLLSASFVLIGYSSYALVPIRSNANPPIDENNPEELLSFISYLKREQYGNRPLFKGQYFTAQVVDQKRGEPIYERGEDKYEIRDYKVEYVYDPDQTTILPRMYSQSGNHPRRYREITGLRKNEDPTFADNLEFMFKRQLGHMYFRYFMWNFSGRESDIQDAGWVGISDAFEEVPTMVEENKGRNIYFMLPLILGILGLIFNYKHDIKNFWVILLLFFLTGAALVLYLNSPPVEPRERDYIYVGSFYAFSIWIGFGVLFLYELLIKALKNARASVILAIVIGMTIPGILAAENWDDHDRSNRYFSVDSAKNYLSSCAPNAIIFTGGDNDTFPLWYVQEVEGFRTDVRVIVLSYFNTDWYIEQMMRQAYESEPLKFNLSLKDYVQGGPNDYLPVVEKIKGAIDAEQFIKLIKQGNPRLRVRSYNSVPSKTFYLNVDTAKVKDMGIIPDHLQDELVSRMRIGVKGRGLEKKDLAILDFIAANDWERPIYFNNTSLSNTKLDIQKYVVQEGLTYRLLPVKSNDEVNYNVMFDNIMNKFKWRGLDNPNVYNSVDYRSFVLNHRATINTLAQKLITEGENEKARELLLMSHEKMPHEAIPYDYFVVQQVSMLNKLGEEELANRIADIMGKQADEMLTFISENSINDTRQIQSNLVVLNELSKAYKQKGENEKALEYENLFKKHYGLIQQ